MLIMMRIVFADFQSVKTSMKWFSLYSPTVLWPVYGISLYEVLNKVGFDVSLFSDDKLLSSIWRRRFGLRIEDRVSGEALIVNSMVYGDLEELLKILNELSNQGFNRDILYTINGSPAFLYVCSGLESSDFINKLVETESIDLQVRNLNVFENPWDLLNNFFKLDLTRVLRFIQNLFDFENLYDNVYVRGDVVIDDRYTYINGVDGPILIFDGSVLEGFNVLKGPAVIGSKTLLSNSKISHSIIGQVCKIGSEVSDSIIMGYSNSAHHGYIGHSLIGYWVNVGAGTVFSDLKNTYGPMKFRFLGREYELGTIKFGSVVGDYSKISINTSIYGGRFIGLSAHVSGLIRDNVEPFTIFDGWLGSSMDMDIEKAIVITERMYSRRGITLLDEEKELFRRVYNELKMGSN